MNKIYGIGVDIIKIKRIEKTYIKYGNRFLKRAFNEDEIKQFYSKTINKYEYLASRYYKYNIDGLLKKQHIKQLEILDYYFQKLV